MLNCCVFGRTSMRTASIRIFGKIRPGLARPGLMLLVLGSALLAQDPALAGIDTLPLLRSQRSGTTSSRKPSHRLWWLQPPRTPVSRRPLILRRGTARTPGRAPSQNVLVQPWRTSPARTSLAILSSHRHFMKTRAMYAEDLRTSFGGAWRMPSAAPSSREPIPAKRLSIGPMSLEQR